MYNEDGNVMSQNEIAHSGAYFLRYAYLSAVKNNPKSELLNDLSGAIDCLVCNHPNFDVVLEEYTNVTDYEDDHIRLVNDTSKDDDRYQDLYQGLIAYRKLKEHMKKCIVTRYRDADETERANMRNKLDEEINFYDAYEKKEKESSKKFNVANHYRMLKNEFSNLSSAFLDVERGVKTAFTTNSGREM